MPDVLTRRQAELLAWLRDYLPQAVHPPSLDEACAALGVASRGSLHKHVQALIAAGLVEPLHGRQRGLQLTAAGLGAGRGEEVPRAIGASLPLLGRVAAGRPIEAIEGTDTVEIGADWAARPGHYALTVRGDSMVDEGIHDGDLIVVEHRSHARDGEIVVALVDGTDATVKRIEQRPGATILHPASAKHAPLVLPPDRVTIQGVVKGLVRRY